VSDYCLLFPKKEKEKQVELLRTTPPNFTPFYKKQTDNYFKRIN